MNLFEKTIQSKYTKWIFFLSSVFGFLILIPLYFTVQPFFKTTGLAFNLGLALLIPFVVLAVIYFLLSLIFIILSPRLSLRLNYCLAGLTAGFGFTHLSLAPTQALLYLGMANLKQDPGLAGLVIFVPTIAAVFLAPFQAMIYGFIGYRLGKREELVKQVEAGKIESTELTKEGLASIFLDAIGIFGVGFLGILVFFNSLFLEPLSLLSSKLDDKFLSFFNTSLLLVLFPASGFLGFYFTRLIGHKIRTSIPNVSHKQTIATVILLFIFVSLSLTLKGVFSSVYENRITKLSQTTSVTNFTETVIPNQNVIERRFEVSANLFVPFDGEYKFVSKLVDLSKEKTLGYEEKYYDELLPTHKISVSTGTQTADEYSSLHLKQGAQGVTFSMEFSGFFDAKTPVWWRNLLKQAIDNNSVGIDIRVYTVSKGGHSEERIFETTHNISQQSIIGLGLSQLLDNSL